MPSPEIEASIRISSSGRTAAEIETHTGWVADRRANNVETRTFFYSSLSENSSLEEHLQHLSEKLVRNSKAINTLQSHGDEVVIWCVVYSQGSFSGFALHADLMERLSGLGVDVIISFYEGD